MNLGAARRLSFLVVAVGIGVRAIGLAWGIPDYDRALAAGNEARTSYHPDEDKILWQLETMKLSPLDLRPRDFRWGSLHTYVVGAALTVCQRVGILSSWKDAFRDALPGGFERIFVVGRAVSAVFGALTLLVVYGLATKTAGPTAGAMAAAFLAVAPLHVVSSHFLTPDVALAFWMALAVLLLTADRPLLSGLAAGLALATKPSAVFLLPVLVWVGIKRDATIRQTRWWVCLGIALGFILGEPYAFIAFPEWRGELLALLRDNGVSFLSAEPLALLGRHLYQIALYGMTPLVFVLALAGSRSSRWLLWAITLLFLSLGLTRFPFARYEIPLLPFLAVAAGIFLSRRDSRTQVAGLLTALLPAFLMCVAQVSLLREPHPANEAARWVSQNVSEGSRIAQLWLDYPVLDRRRYQVELFDDPFALSREPFAGLTADVVITDNFPLTPFRPELQQALATCYVLAARFESPPRIGSLRLPEPGAPHDWKYTHPSISVFRRRCGGSGLSRSRAPDRVPPPSPPRGFVPPRRDAQKDVRRRHGFARGASAACLELPRDTCGERPWPCRGGSPGVFPRG